MKKKLTDEQIAEARLMYEGTALSAADVGAVFDVSGPTIRRALAAAGVDTSISAKARAQYAAGRATRLGAKWGEESRARLSAAKKGSRTSLGRVFSDATKAKMSATRKRLISERPELLHALHAAERRHRAPAPRRERSPEAIARSRARSRFKSLLRRLLKQQNLRKDARCADALGYTAEQLRAHIESKFAAGMCWSRPSSFHIDHVIPVKVFLDRGIADPAIVCALSNLQPLSPTDNRKKQAKYHGNFDEDLARLLELAGSGSAA